jgi:diguanylate cyclase (GGDEF)-like protein
MLQVPVSADSWARRITAGLRRPGSLVEETRWLFLLCNLLALLTVLPGTIAVVNRTTLPLLTLSCLGLVGSWVHLYRTREAPLWSDLVYFVSVAGFTLSCPTPTMGYSFGFTSLWFRAMYGTSRRIVLYTAGTAAAMVGVVVLWGRIPGHESSTPPAAVFGTLPTMFLVVAVFRYLALSLFAREESQRRDAALARFGAELLGLTDQREIYRCTREAVAAFSATTAGLQAFVGFRDAETGAIRLMDQALFPDGPAVRQPEASPSPAVPREPIVVSGSAALSRAAGFEGKWLALPLPDQPSQWIFLGAPKKFSNDVVVAFTSLINQAALALRNSEIHHDLDVQAHTDALTGLMNRSAFTLAVERALEAGEHRLTLMFLDLDDFKTVNDTLGHAAGDELLRQVAVRMREAVRAGDLCARLGGDEFAILVHDDHDAHDGPTENFVAAVAQRLIDLISEPVMLNGVAAQIGTSVGIAYASPDVSTATLLQWADIAMYAAKAQGKNRFQEFEPRLLPTDERTHPFALFGTHFDA